MTLDVSRLADVSEPPDIALEVSRLIEAARQRSIASVDDKALRWLAILPEWTESLARDCRFPPEGSDVGALIEQVRAAELCQVFVQKDLVGERTVRFWMESEVRALLFSRWNQEADLELDLEVKEIADRILGAHKASKPVSPAILRWAQLAGEELTGGFVTGSTLDQRMDESLGSGRISEAGEWLFAAEWLTKPLGAVMEIAAGRARRQLSIHHLRRQDEEYVEKFLPRKHQVDELELLARSTDEWGVHFVGASGVGKTMLMRFVNSKHKENPFRSSSRIDFDYVDPSIPAERPARLLQELGEGFAVELTTSAQRSLFTSFIDSVRVAEAAREAMGSEAVGLTAATEQFDQAVKAFALFLESLPQPVALILDTCEELAKLEPPDGRMWGVDATFDILVQLHAAMPELKLILAGRRWLTSEYANRSRLGASVPESVRNAPGRPFLRFHATRGFTADEARKYLLEVRHVDEASSPIDLILKSTVDNAEVPGLTEDVDDEDRYSPNDLAFCANVLEDDPEAGAAFIEQGNFDAYLKDRIFSRLADVPRLQDVFPAAALLEHFDAAVIEPFLGPSEEEQRALLRRLAEEDWTHLEGGPESDKMVFKVDRGLLPRLQEYYDRFHGRQAVRDEKERKLRLHLARKLGQGPPEATLEVVDAAVRLLPPEEAVEKLAAAADEAAGAGEWSWAEAVSRRLLDAKRKPEIHESMWPTIWALYLTAMRHGQTNVDLAPLWTGVARLADLAPGSDRERLLATRARLVALALTTDARAAPGEVDELLRDGGRMLNRSASDSLASALLAAVESLLDSGETDGALVGERAALKALRKLAKHFKELPGMELHLLALRGRLAFLSGEFEAASETFSEVEDLIRRVDEPPPSLADWQGPSSFAARATLELLRFRLATGSTDGRFLARCEEVAFDAPPGADSAQLLSLVLQARLAQGPPPLMGMTRVAAFEARLDSYQPRVPAHRTAPPLFVSVALGWMACGELRKGMELLDERERRAVSGGTEERSTGAAAMARLQIQRRFRLSEGLALVGHMTGGDREERTEALAAGALIAGIPPTLGPREEYDHAAWRSRNLLDRGESDVAVSAIGPGEVAGGQFGEVHRLLDLLELEYVRERWSGQSRTAEIEGLGKRLVELDWEVPPPSLCDPLGRDRTRVAVRRRALLGDPPPSPGEARPAQFGQIALEEGELLALRLPEQAVNLLAVAVDSFDRAGDRRGAFIASLRQGIAEIHAGRSPQARERQEEIFERYEDLRYQQTALPALATLTSRDPGEVIDPHGLMRGWLWRLAYYDRWCTNRGSSRRAIGMAREFGPEFDFRPATGLGGWASAMRKKELRRRRRAAGVGIAGLVAAVAGSGIAATGALHLIGLSLALSIAVVGVVIVAAVLSVYLLEEVGPRLSRRVIPLDRFDLALISAPRQAAGPTVQAYGHVLVRPRARSLPAWLYLRMSRRWYPGSFTRISTRVRQPGRSPTEIRLALRPTPLGGYAPLFLEVSSDLADISWEQAILAELTAKERWTPKRSPQLVRVRPRGFPRPRTHWGEEVGAICAPRWRQFVEGSVARRVRWSPDLSSGWPRPPAEAGGDDVLNSRAVIALGTAAESRAGWRLRLDEDDFSAPIADPSVARDQDLLDPGQIARRFPVVVLVAPPSDDRPAVDAQSSDGLRGLANEIFLAGAHAVVTVPALPSSVAAKVLSCLVSECEGWSDAPDARRLTRCVQRIRSSIYEGLVDLGSDEGEVTRETRVERALDVCLFGPGRR